MEFNNHSINVWKNNNDIKLIGYTFCMNKNDNEIIITTEDQVLVMNIKTNICINNWSYNKKSLIALTMPAVKSIKSGYFYSVIGKQKNILVVWNETRVEPFISKTHPLKQRNLVDICNRSIQSNDNCSVKALYCHDYLNGSCLAILNDSTFIIYNMHLEKIFDSSSHLQTKHNNDTMEKGDNKEINVEYKENVLFSFIKNDTIQGKKALNTESNKIKKSVLQLILICEKIYKNENNEKLHNQKKIILKVINISIKYQILENIYSFTCSIHKIMDLVPPEKNINDTKYLTISDCVMTGESNKRSLIIVWDSGNIVNIPINSQSNDLIFVVGTIVKEESNEHLSSLSDLNKKRKRVEKSNNHSDLKLCGHSHSSHIIACNSWKLSNNKNRVSLSGWDTKYGVCICINNNLIDKQDMYHTIGNIVQMNCIPIESLNNSCLVIGFEHSLYITEIKSETNSFSNIIGKAEKNIYNKTGFTVKPFFHSNPISSIHVFNTNYSIMEIENIPKKLVSINENETNLLKKLNTDIKITEDFEKCLMEYVNNQINETNEINKKELKTNPLKIKKLCLQYMNYISHPCLIEIIKYILMNPKLNLWTHFQVILSTGKISFTDIPNIFYFAMRNQLYQVLETSLIYLSNINENVYPDILKFLILQKENKKLKHYLRPYNSKGTTNDYTMCLFEKILIIILQKDKNEVFLQNSLKRLTINEVILLLTMLKKYYFLLILENNKNNDNVKMKNDFKKINCNLVLEWISILIDTHLLDLITENKRKNNIIYNILLSINNIVLNHLDTCEEMLKLKEKIYILLKGLYLPKESDQLYSIKTICF